LLPLGDALAVSLFVLLLIVDPDVSTVVAARLALVVELSDCDPLEEVPVAETTELDALDVLTAVCPILPTSVAVLTVPVPFTTASVAFPPLAEVVQLPLLLEEPPATAEVPEPRGLKDVGPVGIR
jgi:hypothetical protein